MGYETKNISHFSAFPERPFVFQFEHATSYWTADGGEESSAEEIIDVFGRTFRLEVGITNFRVLCKIALSYTNPDDADPEYVDMIVYTVTGFYYEQRSIDGHAQRRVKGIKTAQGGWISLANIQSLRMLQ